MKIMIINGPNINMLGIREVELYGTKTYNSLIKEIKQYASSKQIKVCFKQSNHEGDLIDYVQRAYFKKFDAAIINAGGYTHTSISLRDAISSINIPVVEVHLTNPDEREDYRMVNYIKDVCDARFLGEGFGSYIKAIDYLLNK